MATTCSFHYRLVRALADGSSAGALGRAAGDEARRVVAEPPPARLRILDPRLVTEAAARLATRYHLNRLASELVAAALHHGASVRLNEANVGRRWREVMATEGVELSVV